MTHKHDDGEIEGVIWKTDEGIWVMNMGEPTYDQKGELQGRYMKVQVDYCPWCGERLE